MRYFSVSSGSGSGDVVGPASSTDNALARFDSTTGKLLQNSAATLDDSGVLTLSGSMTRSPASITLTANAGTLDVTKGYSTVTITANSTLTPSAAGSNGQTVSVKVTNGGASSFTVTIDNAGTDYVNTVPVGFLWITYISNGTDWIPSVGTPSSASPARASLAYLSDPTTRVDFTSTLSQVADTITLAGLVGTYASPDTTAGTLTLTAAVTEVWTNTTTTYVLPAVASSSGKAVVFYVVDSNAITIDPNASEIIVRDGTAQTGGVTMTLTGTAGNYVSMVCDGTRWVTLGYKGTLAAGS